MLVRRELPDDVPQVASVVARAFARDDGAVPAEVPLLAALREGPDWLPRLSWVAVDDAGSALVHALLGAADVLGAPLVGVLGDPGYYGRFGFRPGSALGVDPPEAAWGRHFQVRTLTAHDEGLRGTFRYAQPFDDL